MSSLAAARADNFYYPPEYRAEHGSLNKFRGSHGALGARANKLHEGILVIRFEMPYKVFCNKCNEVIAKGVRFNAEKKTVGNYFSTKILEFSMKCCFCSNTLKIQTDPKNCEYIPTEGCRRKVETFEAEDAETLEYRTAEERHEIEKDPMLKLETVTEDVSKAKQSHQRLEDLMAFNEARNSSDVQYDLNLKVRKRFREWKKEEIAKEVEAKKPRNFAIPLLSEDPQDLNAASSVDFCTNSRRLGRRIKQRVLETSSIFAPPAKKQSKSRTRLPIAAESSTANCSSSSKPSRNKLSMVPFSQLNKPGMGTSSSNPSPPPRLIPCAAHKALSLVVPQKAVVKHSVSKDAQKKPTPLERRSRLCGELEKLRTVRRSAARASILAHSAMEK